MKLRYIFLVICFFILKAITISAQQRLTFRVADFHQNPLDLTARNDQFKRMDDNGALYSIIKVTSDLPDDELKSYVFDFGLMNSFTEIHQDDGELWVYVQKNAKTVTIRREGYATISKYDLGTTIAAGATYEMRLSVQAAAVLMQMVMFRVKPATAKAFIVVKLEQPGAVDEALGMVDETGAVAKSLPFGSYTYRVAAENYYPSEGRFTLNNQAENHVEDVTLRGNFGNITLNVESEADIYVDGEKKGTRTWTGSLKAGSHQVECRQANHKPSVQAISVAENETANINLTPPTPITGTLAVTSRPLGAKILIDGQDYGKTPKNVSGLLIGRHTLALTTDGYQESRNDFDIQENKVTELTIELSLQQKSEAVQQPAQQRQALRHISKTSDGRLDMESFSYVYGMANTNGLKNFLSQKMGVDTLMMADFLRGFDKNSIALENSYLMSDATKAETQMKAFMAGKEIRTQVENQIIPSANKQIGDSAYILDNERFIEGFHASLAGNAITTEENAKNLAEKQMEYYGSLVKEKKYGKNRRDGESFLAANAKKRGVHTTESGLQYEILSAGRGRKPTGTDKVKVNYEGHLIDGTEFDSSYKRNQPATFAVNQVIKGWTEALTMMPVGSKWRIYIPQELGYGSREASKIPPFSCLIFTVELLEIID